MSSFTKRNPQADPFFTQFGDTLNYYQVSQNISSSLAYSFGDSLRQSMNLTGSFAQSQNITGRLDDAGAFGLNVDQDTTLFLWMSTTPCLDIACNSNRGCHLVGRSTRITP